MKKQMDFQSAIYKKLFNLPGNWVARLAESVRPTEFTFVEIDGQAVSDDMIISLGAHTAIISFEYEGEIYEAELVFMTTSEE